MQVSLLLLPTSVEPPAIGTELDCDVRLTTLHPDARRPPPTRRRRPAHSVRGCPFDHVWQAGGYFARRRCLRKARERRAQ